VRGKVTTPKKLPAHVVWKHTEEQQDLKPQMQDVLEDARKAEDLDSLTISSGRRQPVIPGDPHADGRAVDVSRINGVAVKGQRSRTDGREGPQCRRQPWGEAQKRPRRQSDHRAKRRLEQGWPRMETNQ
jgi:hypothetical protein